MIDVDRSSESAPHSLGQGKYGASDVRQALCRVFLGKCYLCETPLEAGTLSVDHHKPKSESPELECAWENLFPTCNTHRCNERRSRSWPDGGLLDPARGDGVETRLFQAFEGMPSRVLAAAQSPIKIRFNARSPDDRAAQNTAAELDRIHSGTGSSENARLTAAALQKLIAARIFTLAERVRKLDTAHLEASAEIVQARLELQILFSRRAPYTMLVRSVFAHRPDLRALFD